MCNFLARKQSGSVGCVPLTNRIKCTKSLLNKLCFAVLNCKLKAGYDFESEMQILPFNTINKIATLNVYFQISSLQNEQ